MGNARETAFRMLYKCHVRRAYSNIAFDSELNKSGLSADDKRFAAALGYGTLERMTTLDRIISEYSSIPPDKLSPEVLCAVRLCFYQLIYMDSVPDSAAVNETVELVKNIGRVRHASGYVNAVARAFIRSGKRFPAAKNTVDELSIEYSCPHGLVEKWLDEYTPEQTLSLLRSSVGKPPVTLRANTRRCSASQLVGELEREGVEACENRHLDDCVDLISSVSIEETDAYKRGLFHVQDVASQLCCEALEPKSARLILDVCSAPGGKAFTCAEATGGRVMAFDIHEKRVKLIKDGASRLGLDNISALTADAGRFDPGIPKADRVLCDVVCSGLGVIRRKPEIKYKPLRDFERLPEIQYAILDTASRYVACGGILVYSTCTVSRAENDRVVERFLSGHDEFEAVDVSDTREDMKKPFVTLTPDMYGSDGFFIAKMRRR